MAVLSQEIEQAFTVLKSTLQGNTTSSITCTTENMQYSLGDLTIVFGFASCRLIVVDNDRSASIQFSPVQIEVGDFKIDKGLTINLFASSFRETRESLFIGSGELFQLGTIHNFDFNIITDIVPKYLELLEALPSSQYMSNVHQGTYDETIESFREVAKKYAEE